MTRRRLVWLVAAVALVLGAPAQARDRPALTRFLRAMACTRPVDPERSLEALQREGDVAAKPVVVEDGIPLLPVRHPFTFGGLAVQFVEGWDYHGRLFEHDGPGTSPPVFIGVAIHGHVADVQRRIPEVHIGDPLTSRHSWARYVYDDTDLVLDPNPRVAVVCSYQDRARF